jgi:predicted TIM-barrel fold metal-dependent hydrolase
MQLAPTDKKQQSTRLMLVSADAHCGPLLMGQLREYCPAAHLGEFDAYAASPHAPWSRELPGFSPLPAEQMAIDRTTACRGNYDPYARLSDLDQEGIAGEVIFGGGQNGERLPFMGEGLGASPGPGALDDAALLGLGLHIYNQWLVDFVSVEPARHVGLAHLPIWDIAASVREVEWARDAGLRGVNFPAPRSEWLPFNDPAYEPFWSACEALDMPLCTHAGGGDPPLGATEPGGIAVWAAELFWMGRRALWQLIFGGVFERHPGLKLIFTEQFTSWVPQTLNELDGIYSGATCRMLRAELPRKPSEYWASNCYIAQPYPAPFEIDLLHEVGTKNLMWGADYPHQEGTWPNTLPAIRHAFRDTPEPEARRILGENALEVFDFDASALRKIADRIGPSFEQVKEPLAAFPEHRGLAFRELGANC